MFNNHNNLSELANRNRLYDRASAPVNTVDFSSQRPLVDSDFFFRPRLQTPIWRTTLPLPPIIESTSKLNTAMINEDDQGDSADVTSSQIFNDTTCVLKSAFQEPPADTVCKECHGPLLLREFVPHKKTTTECRKVGVLCTHCHSSYNLNADFSRSLCSKVRSCQFASESGSEDDELTALEDMQDVLAQQVEAVMKQTNTRVPSDMSVHDFESTPSNADGSARKGYFLFDDSSTCSSAETENRDLTLSSHKHQAVQNLAAGEIYRVAPPCKSVDIKEPIINTTLTKPTLLANLVTTKHNAKSKIPIPVKVTKENTICNNAQDESKISPDHGPNEQQYFINVCTLHSTSMESSPIVSPTGNETLRHTPDETGDRILFDDESESEEKAHGSPLMMTSGDKIDKTTQPLRSSINITDNGPPLLTISGIKIANTSSLNKIGNEKTSPSIAKSQKKTETSPLVTKLVSIRGKMSPVITRKIEKISPQLHITGSKVNTSPLITKSGSKMEKTTSQHELSVTSPSQSKCANTQSKTDDKKTIDCTTSATLIKSMVRDTLVSKECSMVQKVTVNLSPHQQVKENGTTKPNLRPMPPNSGNNRKQQPNTSLPNTSLPAPAQDVNLPKQTQSFLPSSMRRPSNAAPIQHSKLISVEDHVRLSSAFSEETMTNNGTQSIYHHSIEEHAVTTVASSIKRHATCIDNLLQMDVCNEPATLENCSTLKGGVNNKTVSRLAQSPLVKLVESETNKTERHESPRGSERTTHSSINLQLPSKMKRTLSPKLMRSKKIENIATAANSTSTHMSSGGEMNCKGYQGNLTADVNDVRKRLAISSSPTARQNTHVSYTYDGRVTSALSIASGAESPKKRPDDVREEMGDVVTGKELSDVSTRFSKDVERSFTSTPKPSSTTRSKGLAHPCSSEPEPMNDLEVLSDPLRSVQESIQLLEHEEWEKRCQAINTIRRLAFHHRHDVGDKLHQLCCLLVKEVKNLRSQARRLAIVCIGELFLHFKRLMDQDVEPIVAALLSKSAETYSFIQGSVEVALKHMTDNVSPVKAVVGLINGGASHKNSAVRRTTSYFVAEVCERLGAQKVLSGAKDLTDKVLTVACNFLLEALPETRYNGQRILWGLMQQENFEQQLKKHVPDTLVQNVSQKLDLLRKKGLNERQSTMCVKTKTDTVETTPTKKSVVPSKHSTVSTAQITAVRSVHGQPVTGPVENVLDSICNRMKTQDWKERFEGVAAIRNFVLAKPMTASHNVVKIFDSFVPCLQDSVSKVTLHSLSIMADITEKLSENLGSVLNMTIKAIASNLASKKAELIEAATAALDAITDRVDKFLLIQPFCALAMTGSPRIRPDMIERVAYIVSDVYPRKPKHVNMHILPLLWNLLGASGSHSSGAPAGISGPVRTAALLLVKSLHQLYGDDLVNVARQTSVITPRKQRLLQDLLKIATKLE